MSKKAGSSAPKVEHTYSPDDIVLGKIKGYPMWPGQVVDPVIAPPNVVREKPKGKNQNTQLVQFFPAADFAWLNVRDMQPLSAAKIKQHLDSAKGKGDLVKAYRIAQDPSEWRDQREEINAEYHRLQAAAAEDQDELESDHEATGAKRKRKSDAAGGKKAGADKKAKISQPAKSKASTSKASTDAPKKASTGSENDSPGLKQVRDWRHKLQKAFLSNKKGTETPLPIKAEDMPKCNEYFEAMENFDMKMEWLAETKLGKVLKRISLLQDDAIPSEGQYHFKDRSLALGAKWTSSDSTDTPKPAEDASPEATPSAPAAASDAAPAPAPPIESGLAEDNKPSADKQANGDDAMAVDAPEPKENGESADNKMEESKATESSATEASAPAPAPVEA